MQDARADAALDARPLELNSTDGHAADASAAADSNRAPTVNEERLADGLERASGAKDAAQRAELSAAEGSGGQAAGVRSDEGRGDRTASSAQAGEAAPGEQAEGFESKVAAQQEGLKAPAVVEFGVAATAGEDGLPRPAVAGDTASEGATAQALKSVSTAAQTPAAAIVEAAAGPATAPMAPVLVEPKPSNPAAARSALLPHPDGLPSPSESPAVSVTSGTPPPPSLTGGASDLADAAAAGATSSSAAPSAAANAAARASPAPSASSASGAAGTEKPAGTAPPVKKFSSSLSVNKKFLEKAGEKAKPEVKPATTRLATPPAPAPTSSNHPRLLAGKLSSSGTLSLSTAPASAAAAGWNKKPTSPVPTSAPGQAASASRPTSSVSSGPAGRAGGAVWASSTRGGGAAGGLNRMTNDFPTAAEAARAKELRAQAMMEQMQARERAEQARAALAAAKNAHLLEELDAFRGKHLDPNAHHWDEDDDDFLDTTIEFADGTQYKIEQQAQADSAAQSVADDELREPGPTELALREKPLAPGEVVEAPKREERFGDDFDRSWPRRPAAGGDSRNLFNERVGRLEPAASGRRAGPGAAEPSSILRPRERRPSDVPPHMAAGSAEPKGRRPSVTSPKASHAPLHPGPAAPGRRPSMNEPKPSAWGRRPSAGMADRQLPPHLAAGGGRQLPPHMQAQVQAQQPEPPAAPAAAGGRGALSPPSRQRPLPSGLDAALSPPRRAGAELAPPPPGAQPSSVPAPSGEPAAAAPAGSPAEPVPSIEEMHLREMHAAAERAKKRREEEEQKRLEQIERAKRKAAELEEKMKAAEEAKAKAKAEAEKLKAEAKAEAKAKADAEARAKPEARAAKTAASQPPAVSAAPADLATSWRTAPRPPASIPAPVPTTAAPVPSRILAREVAHPPKAIPAGAKQPTSILPRPNQGGAQDAQATDGSAPAQTAAWRRAEPVRPAQARGHGRQMPPHLAAAAAASAAAAAVSAEKAASEAKSAAADTVHPTSPPATSPPAKIASPPTSPSHKRESSQGGAAKTGYKLPAVSQLDDLMSRIKGAMIPAAEEEAAAAARAGDEDRPRVKLPTATAAPAATVKLPPKSANSRPAAEASTAERGRGRGRGRQNRPEPERPGRAGGPAFESREPIAPFHSSRVARSRSPPPAWKQYVVRLAAQPRRRPPQRRLVKNFESQKYPQPLYPFSWSPILRDTNPRRLSRDDMLLPQRYAPNGVPIFPVRFARRHVRRPSHPEASSRPTPTVSISRRALIRSTEEPPRPVSPLPQIWADSADVAQTAGSKPIDAVFGASALTAALGGEDVSRSSHWRLGSGTNGSSTIGEQPESAPALSAIPRPSATPTYGMTGQLNGEIIEATPRKETAAPGFDAASLRMNPKSPAFQPAELGSLSASPSAAAWPNKSLALSVLDPTAPSVWSTAPAENSVRIRTMSAVQPENSLQGLLDDDPSEVLPSSLAELKSEDGHSTEAPEPAPQQDAQSKDEARLRALAPSFSAFLHESAAAIDSSASPAPRPVYYPESGAFANGIEPQPSPSPISAYGPQAYPAHLYQSSRAFGQPLYPAYPVGAPPTSPYATAGYPGAYSAQPYHAPSPVPPTLGYPSPYREPGHPGVPSGITNPALIATYGYGQPGVMPSAPRYGAVGAGGPAPIGRGPSSQYGRATLQPAPPTNSISPAYNSPYAQGPAAQHRYRSPSPFGDGIQGSPPLSARVAGPSSTMASPVIVPQQLPPVPSFGTAGSAVMYGQQQPEMTSPVPRGAGPSPYGGMPKGAYAGYSGANGAPSFARGGAPAAGRGGKVGGARW